MSTVGIRELARNAGSIIAEVERTRRPTFVTRRGRPAVAIVALDAGELEDFILATAPEFAESLHEADAELRAGTTRSLAQVADELADAARARRSGTGRRRAPAGSQ